jgi:hypothetical protein
MYFKKWLQLQESTPVTRGKELAYPPEPDAFSHSTEPKSIQNLKTKLKEIKATGRKLINWNPETVYKIPYYTMQSRSLPDEGWQHKEDNNQKGAVSVIKTKNLITTTITSRSMPSSQFTGGWWRHREDDDSVGSVEIIRLAK